MEKYTNWRDRGTGIAPFLPPAIGGLSIGTKIAIGSAFLVKCVFLLPLVALYGLTKSKTIYRWLLCIFFNWKTEVNVQGVKRRDVKELVHYPQRDKLYLCNSSSPLDAVAMYLIAQGPTWFLVCFENAVFKMTANDYMYFVLDGSLNVKKFGQEVGSIDQLKGCVLFMFPEGTSSNGKSILPFQIDSRALEDFLGDPSSSSYVQIVHIKINGTLVAPLAISKVKYFMRMLSKGVSIKIKINEAQLSNPIDNLRVTLNDGNKFKLVSKTLDIESKREFAQEFSFTTTK